jgi:hypothetical protein
MIRQKLSRGTMMERFLSDILLSKLNKGNAKMKLSKKMIPLFWAAVICGCSSPAKVEVRPDPLILKGKDAKGQLEAIITDQDGKQLRDGYSVTWMCLDSKTVKVQQDGTAIAQSSGKALVDVEIVGTDIHGMGNVIVIIPSWIETSHEEVQLVTGGKKFSVWAEVRDDNGVQIKGYLPKWKVDDPKIISIEAMQDSQQMRAYLKLTSLAPGETYITATHEGLAADIHVTVINPPEPQ